MKNYYTTAQRERILFWAFSLSLLSLAVSTTFVAGATTTATTTLERRLSDSFGQWGMTVKTIAERPDQPSGDVKYIVKDAFTTVNGQLQPAADEGSIPEWATAYMSANFLEAGAEQSLFAAIIGLDGELIKDHNVRFWSDGFQQLDNAEYQNYVNEKSKQSSGWANNPLWHSSAFYPDQGQNGPWCWTPDGVSEVVCGGGLPDGRKISTFVVWQAVEGDVEIVTPTPTVSTPTVSTPVPTITSPVGTPTPTASAITPSPTDFSTPTPTSPISVTQRLGTWVDYLNLEINPFAERPDAERENFDESKTVYILKDLFTTRDGQWEPAAREGSVDDWARQSYLKPFGADDYFDDAGADHHLFAAVIGLDGKLITETAVIYWSDGYTMLADSTYAGYALQLTKARSGWANIFIAEGSSYRPLDGQQGPWCWAPAGAADVVCGAGLPLKWHVSTFAVWQAVRQSDLVELPNDDSNRFSIFLPLINREE